MRLDFALDLMHVGTNRRFALFHLLKLFWLLGPSTVFLLNFVSRLKKRVVRNKKEYQERGEDVWNIREEFKWLGPGRKGGKPAELNQNAVDMCS